MEHREQNADDGEISMLLHKPAREIDRTFFPFSALPSALALASPAFTRSRIMARSNFAKTPII
jgi:hypothetical protein